MNWKKSIISNIIYGRRHSKPFTNCHVSWDTLYKNNGRYFQTLTLCKLERGQHLNLIDKVVMGTFVYQTCHSDTATSTTSTTSATLTQVDEKLIIFWVHNPTFQQFRETPFWFIDRHFPPKSGENMRGGSSRGIFLWSGSTWSERGGGVGGYSVCNRVKVKLTAT